MLQRKFTNPLKIRIQQYLPDVVSEQQLLNYAAIEIANRPNGFTNTMQFTYDSKDTYMQQYQMSNANLTSINRGVVTI